MASLKQLKLELEEENQKESENSKNSNAITRKSVLKLGEVFAQLQLENSQKILDANPITDIDLIGNRGLLARIGVSLVILGFALQILAMII